MAFAVMAASMANKNRNFRVRKHLGGHAAEHDGSNAAASVRGHDDEVATPLLGGHYDGFVWMVFFDLHRVADESQPRELVRQRHRVSSARALWRARHARQKRQTSHRPWKPGPCRHRTTPPPSDRK